MSGLYKTTEESMIAAHKAGVEYWKRNKPHNATDENLRSLARSCGFHGDDNDSWLAGFKGAQRRDTNQGAPNLTEGGKACYSRYPDQNFDRHGNKRR